VSEFFSEVDEAVRREQLKKLWDKYWLVFIAAAILIIAAVGGWRGYRYVQGQRAEKAGTTFNQAIALADQGKHSQAEAAFAAIAAKAPAGYRTLARLQAAGQEAALDPKAAAKMFDAIAADGGVGAEFQALARVRAAGLLVDSISYAEMKRRIGQDTRPDAAFRYTARELLALSAFRAKDISEARKWLDMIALDGETPPGVRQRAEALQALLPPIAKS
jgi:hypothetical protein